MERRRVFQYRADMRAQVFHPVFSSFPERASQISGQCRKNQGGDENEAYFVRVLSGDSFLGTPKRSGFCGQTAGMADCRGLAGKKRLRQRIRYPRRTSKRLSNIRTTARSTAVLDITSHSSIHRVGSAFRRTTDWSPSGPSEKAP